jgi:hypothetical protein
MEPWKNITVKGKPEDGTLINGAMRYSESIHTIQDILRKPRIKVTNLGIDEKFEIRLIDFQAVYYAQGRDGKEHGAMIKCENNFFWVKETAQEVKALLCDAGVIKNNILQEDYYVFGGDRFYKPY